MLYTNLQHIENAAEYHQIIAQNERVVVCCGRMDPQSIGAYHILEVLRLVFHQVLFADMEYDNPEFGKIRHGLALDASGNVPCLMYCQGGEIVWLSRGYQSRDQIHQTLKAVFADLGQSQLVIKNTEI